MGNGNGLPPGALGQCRCNDSMSSITVDFRQSRLAAGGLPSPARVPARVSQRANCIFRQLVDREISSTKFERRLGTNNDGDDRQTGLVIGRFGQRCHCSRQIVGTSCSQRDYQRVRLAR